MYNTHNIMNKKFLVMVTMFAALLLPAVATAAVVVNNSISLNVSDSNVNQVYMETGPGYSSAHSAGYITMSGNNQKYTNATINLNGIKGSGYAVISNAVEIYSAVPSGTVHVWLNLTSSISGVSIFESHSPATFTGSSLSGATQILSGTNSFEFNVESTPGVVAFLSFEVTGLMTSSGSLSLQYSIA